MTKNIVPVVNDVFLVQITEFKKRLNTVISACEEVVRCLQIVDSNFGTVNMHFS